MMIGRMLVLLAVFAVRYVCAEDPAVTVGIVSDVHMNPDDTSHLHENRFRKALEFFDRKKVDAVAGCGDYVEFGWHQWYRLLGKYWFERFPGNRRSDGQPVVPLFAYGDHEMENRWNGNITRRFSSEYILERDIPTYGRARLYEETFKEPWAPIMRKRVKGYDFVLGHFTMREDGHGNICDDGKLVPWGEYIPGLDEFFATNVFDSARPFFYFQHLPPRNTVISPLVTGQDDGSSHRLFAGYPNAVVFCGHRHKSATSERNLWQGEFTCVQVPAMEDVQTDAGHENGWASCDGYVPTNPAQQMDRVRVREDGGQCLLMHVYSNRLVIERWNVDYAEKVADDWVVPLGRKNLGAASFEHRAKTSKPVAFGNGAKVSVAMRRGKDRAGVPSDQYVVTFPAAKSSPVHARGYDYRVTARLTKHYWTRTVCEKWVYSDKCFLPESKDTNAVTCVFSKSEIPGPFESLQFIVMPYNAFGHAGKPIASEAFRYRSFPAAPQSGRLPKAKLDRGGVTFDFDALSKKRFDLDVSQCVNLAEAPRNGSNGSVTKATLPDKDGGEYHLSFRYRMPNVFPIRQDAYSLGGCRLIYDNGGTQLQKVLVAVGDWHPFSRTVSIPKGVGKIEIKMELHRDSKFDFKDLALVKSVNRPEFELKLGGHANLGNSFALSAGQCSLLMFECRKSPSADFDAERVSFAVRLPKYVTFVDSSFAEPGSVKVEKLHDGGSLIAFSRRKNFEIGNSWNYWAQGGVLVRTAPNVEIGEIGQGRIEAFCDGRRIGVSDDILFVAEPAIAKAIKPKLYFQGIDYGVCYNRAFNTDAAQLEYARFMSDCGLDAIIADRDTPHMRDILHKGGIRYVLANLSTCANGYMMGFWDDLPPEDIRFVFDVDPEKGEHENKRSRSVCPIAIYSESDWFRNEYLPRFARDIKGADGLWANWELYMYVDRGCFCSRCRKSFSVFIGVSDDELKTEWPGNALGKYRVKWEDFRSREHGRVVRTINRHVTALTGGAKSLGFIPGVEWADMSSCWRDENLAAQYRPISYAGDLKWIEPWGPYAAWESNEPYFYLKYKPIAPFFAAADLRQQIDRDYPAPNRPKLMSYPQGFQGGTWVSQPEIVAMSFDSYFFNRWEASTLYHFPKGADARYWRRFSECATRAARYEDWVFKGRETTSFVSAHPVDEYAQPVAYATRFVPWSRNASMLQTRAFSHGGVRIVAVFNFWQKGEAFFDLKARGLDGKFRLVDEDGVIYVKDDGSEIWSADELAAGIRLMVGASRTKVYEIVPEAKAISGRSVITPTDVEMMYRSSRERLRKAADEDRRYEKNNGTPTRNCYPMI